MTAPTDFILCTLGTRGDIAPFAALAAALTRRGARVTLLANENWAGLAQASGAAFQPIAPPDPPQSGRDDFAFFESNVLPSFRRSFEHINMARAAGRRLVIVHKMGMHGAACAAEKLGLSSVRVALQPSAIRSRHRPAWPLTALTRGPCRGLTRPLIPAVYLLREMTGRCRAHVNGFRRSVGLRPLRFNATSCFQDLTLVLCPRWFAMPQADWPDPCQCTGFPFDAPAPIDAGLADFIGRHGPPLVFTPGTGVTAVRTFFQAARQVCGMLDLPGVFLSPLADRHDDGHRIFCLDFAELGGLLPRARMLVHHGGIGTTAQALRAGIPQLVLPGRFDQPDNAMRIAELRVGAVCLSPEPDARAWADLARRALADSAMRLRFSRAARDIAATDGAARAAELLIQLAAAPAQVTARRA